MSSVKKIVYLNEEGILARTQGGELTNIGGTTHSTFTVGGRPVMLEGGLNATIDFQYVYDKAIELDGSADIKLQSGKAFTILSPNGLNTYFNVDADTGNIQISGLLNGIDLALLNSNLNSHISLDAQIKHDADQIAVSNIANATNVQEAIENIQSSIASGITTKFISHTQVTPLSTWTISHNQNTKRIVWTLWDENDEMIIPDTVFLVDNNTIQVVFGVPQAGRLDMVIYVS